MLRPGSAKALVDSNALDGCAPKAHVSAFQNIYFPRPTDAQVVVADHPSELLHLAHHHPSLIMDPITLAYPITPTYSPYPWVSLKMVLDTRQPIGARSGVVISNSDDISPRRI